MAQEDGEGGPELVAGLGEEGPLPLLGLLQGLEQGVHRLHHAPELVLGQAVGHGVQAVWASARDLPGHGLQGPGGEAGREVDQSQAQGEEEEEGAEEGFPEGLEGGLNGARLRGEDEEAQGRGHEGGGEALFPEDLRGGPRPAEPLWGRRWSGRVRARGCRLGRRGAGKPRPW